jgi:hypothetical protein
MPEAGDYILVTFVDKQQQGMRFKRSRNIWPLHNTVVGWFSLSAAKLEAFNKDLSTIASKNSTYDLLVGAEKLFGEDHSVPVNTLSDPVFTSGMHSALLNLVKKHDGTQVNELWVGKKYEAHITQHENARCTEGDTFRFDHFQLVKLLNDGICEVGERFMLRGSNE